MPWAAVPLFLGQNDRDPLSDLPPGWWRLAQNVRAITAAQEAAVRVREGMTRLNTTTVPQGTCQGFFSWKDSGGTVRQLYAGSSNLYYSGDWSTPLSLPNGETFTFASDDLFSFVYHRVRDMVYFTCGSTSWGTMFRFDGTDIHPWGADAPTTKPTVADGGSGNVNGPVRYVYCYRRSADGQLTNASAVSDEFSGSSKKVDLTFTQRPDPEYDQIVLYRTRQNGQYYYKVTDSIDGTPATPSYTDNTADASLGAQYGLGGDDVDGRPPVGRAVTQMSSGRIVVLGDVENDYPRRVFPAFDIESPESFPDWVPAGNENGSRLLCAAPLGDDLVLIAEDSLWTMDSTCTMCQVAFQGYGGVGPWCACETPYGVAFVGYGGVKLFAGSTPRHISGPLDGTWDTLDRDRLWYSSCAYEPELDVLLVSITSTSGGTRNDKVLALDCSTIRERMPRWSEWPIYADTLHVNTGLPPSVRKTYVAIGRGVVCEMFQDGMHDAAGSGTKRGTVTGAGSDYIEDSTASFQTTGDGLVAAWVRITEGTGAGQVREIKTNTATKLTVYTTWATQPDTTSKYQIGAIQAKLDAGEWDFKDSRRLKHFKSLALEMEQ